LGAGYRQSVAAAIVRSSKGRAEKDSSPTARPTSRYGIAARAAPEEDDREDVRIVFALATIRLTAGGTPASVGL